MIGRAEREGSGAGGPEGGPAGGPAAAPLVLITRPAPDGAAFAEALRRAAPGPWRAALAPLGRIAPRPAPEIPDGAEIILTSRNALRALERAGALGALAGRRAWCVGGATARAAREAGLAPEAPEEGGDAEALVARLLRERPLAPLVHLRGEPAAGAVAARLRAAGLRASEAVVYAQEPVAPPPEALAAFAAAAEGLRVLAPVFSPRGAERLSRAAAEAGTGGAGLHAVALSPAVAVALRLRGARVALCARPDAAAMIAALAPLLADPA